MKGKKSPVVIAADQLKPSYDDQTRIWSGGKKLITYDSNYSIGHVLFNSLKNYGNNILQISDTENITMTNREALLAAIRIAQHFKKMGLNHEDVVGIVGRNTTYAMPVSVACLFNCTPFHGVNPDMDNKSLTKILAQTKPKIIFCDGQNYDKIRLISQSFKPLIYTLCDHIEGWPTVLDLLEPTATERFYSPQHLTKGKSQTMAILCSSGTTGLPKSVCVSNYALFLDIDGLTNDDVFYSSSGLDWITGVWCLTASCMFGFKRVITNRPYSAEYFVELVKKYRISIAFVAPRHVAALIKCPSATSAALSSFRLVGLGGGSISFTSMQAMKSLVKNAITIYGYGITEVGNIAQRVEAIEKSASVGQLVPGIHVRIVDDDERNLGPGEVGEIYINNGQLWNGYYGNTAESAKMQDKDGWFHSGDLGYFDDNKFLYLVDRKKEIVKYNGMQYWPKEIEDCISELPDVVDVCVVGVYDESCGDAAGALVVRTKDSVLSEQDIRGYVAKKLIMPHKHINAGVLFVERLPMNHNGKTIKKQAKELFVSAMLNVDR